MATTAIGRMRERLTPLQAEVTRDDHGTTIVAAAGWQSLVTSVAAELLPEQVAERLVANQVQGVVTYRFRTWARADITPAMRCSWRPSWHAASQPAKTLEITGLVPVGDGRQWMTIACVEVAA